MRCGGKLEVVLPWPASFRVALAGCEPDQPTVRTLAFGRDPARGRHEPGALTLRVIPTTSRPWVGVFHGPARTGVLTETAIGWPDGHSLLVVQGGEAVLVPAHEPEQARPLDACEPVVHLLVVRDQQLVVLGSSTGLAAYGPDRLRWRADPLCWDGLEVLGVEDGTVVCRGSAATGETRRTLHVDLATGRCPDPCYP